MLDLIFFSALCAIPPCLFANGAVFVHIVKWQSLKRPVVGDMNSVEMFAIKNLVHKLILDMKKNLAISQPFRWDMTVRYFVR